MFLLLPHCSLELFLRYFHQFIVPLLFLLGFLRGGEKCWDLLAIHLAEVNFLKKIITVDYPISVVRKKNMLCLIKTLGIPRELGILIKETRINE